MDALKELTSLVEQYEILRRNIQMMKKEEEKESNSRLGTPFRVGLKASVVASSIFDSPLGKKEESPRRLGRGKKAMIQSKNIMNYFSPKKSGKHNDLENTRYRVWLQQTDHT